MHACMHAGVLLPLPGVIFVLASEKYQYVFTEMPPVICSPSNATIAYFSLILPNNIILMVGVVMIIVILWRVRKVGC